MTGPGLGPTSYLHRLEPTIIGVSLHFANNLRCHWTGKWVSSHEEVMAGDMGRVTVVSSALLWPSEHVIVAWSGDAQTCWAVDHWYAPIVFPDQVRNGSCYLQFAIPQIRAKTTTKKSPTEKKIMSHHDREHRIKIQVLWFRSISWRRWLFPCIINRRYWIDISQPAR